MPYHPSHLCHIVPNSFDMVIINKRKGPAAVDLAQQQVAKLQKVGLNPRRQIISRPDIWSDHISVEATVRKVNGALLRCATWNVADPRYYKNYHKTADRGFEDVDEGFRLDKVQKQVRLLLSRSDCVALQEVPASLAPKLDADAERAGYTLRKQQPKPSRMEECADAQHLTTCPRLMLFIRSEFSTEPPSTLITPPSASATVGDKTGGAVIDS